MPERLLVDPLFFTLLPSALSHSGVFFVINIMKRAKQVTYGVIGIILLIVGVLGLILPILPGLVLILAGLILLSLEIPTLDVFLNENARRNTQLDKYYTKARTYIREKLGYHI
jgi:Putative transmembrane protein (PGPGW)